MSRYLALDVGDERVGIAISDEMAVLARPYDTIRRVSGPASFLRIVEIIEHEGVDRIIVGLPLLEDGARGKQTASTEAYVRGLSAHVDIPIIYWDERYTTREAQEILDASGRTARNRRHDVDAVAAAVILQDYIQQQMEERS